MSHYQAALFFSNTAELDMKSSCSSMGHIQIKSVTIRAGILDVKLIQ